MLDGTTRQKRDNGAESRLVNRAKAFYTQAIAEGQPAQALEAHAARRRGLLVAASPTSVW